MDPMGVLKLLWPLLVFHLIAAAWAIIDIRKRGKTKTLNSTAWILIALFVNSAIGPALYFLFGRTED